MPSLPKKPCADGDDVEMSSLLPVYRAVQQCLDGRRRCTGAAVLLFDLMSYSVVGRPLSNSAGRSQDTCSPAPDREVVELARHRPGKNSSRLLVAQTLHAVAVGIGGVPSSAVDRRFASVGRAGTTVMPCARFCCASCRLCRSDGVAGTYRPRPLRRCAELRFRDGLLSNLPAAQLLSSMSLPCSGRSCR